MFTQARSCTHQRGHGYQNPNRLVNGTQSNRFNPTTKSGNLKWVVNSPKPLKWDPIGVDPRPTGHGTLQDTTIIIFRKWMAVMSVGFTVGPYKRLGSLAHRRASNSSRHCLRTDNLACFVSETICLLLTIWWVLRVQIIHRACSFRSS